MTLGFLWLLRREPNHRISSARQSEGTGFLLTVAAFLLDCQQAKESPPKLLRRRYQNCESLVLPEYSRCTARWGLPPASPIPGTRCPVLASFFFFFLRLLPLALAPQATLLSCPLSCVADSQPQTSPSWVPLAFCDFFPLQQTLAASWITKGTRLAHNE